MVRPCADGHDAQQPRRHLRLSEQIVAPRHDGAIAPQGQRETASRGDGGHPCLRTPAGRQPLLQLTGVTAIAAGGGFSLALRGDGTVVAWGDDLFGQTEVPAGLSGIMAIGAGTYHALAVRTDGTVVQWGGYEIGTPQGNHPTPPPGLSNVSAVAGGRNHSIALAARRLDRRVGCARPGRQPRRLVRNHPDRRRQRSFARVRADGTVVSWMAAATAGPLGVEDRGQANVPPGLAGVLAIAGGFHHSLTVAAVVPAIPITGISVIGQLVVGAGLLSIGMLAVALGRSRADRRRRATA